MSARCPVCRQASAGLDENRAFPFCSERCRLLDLGKWLDGQYRIAGERAGDGAAGPAPEQDQGQGDPQDS